jgi:hypothetical protein
MAPWNLDFFFVSGYTKKKSGAVARALHHEVRRNSLPAVFENVSSTTSERKYMSKKTTFKRIALVAVAALGLGVLSVGPTSAAVTSPTVTLSGTTGLTAVVNESTTAVTATVGFFASTTDTVIVGTRITTNTGGTALVKLRATDSNNATTYTNADTSAFSDTATAVVGNANASVTYSLVAYGFSAVGTYTVNVVMGTCPAGTSVCTPATITVGASASYNVVVSAASTAATSIRTYTAAAGQAGTAGFHKARFGASTDSAVVVSAGTPSTTYTAAAVIYANLFTAASETVTGTSRTNICASGCTVNAFIDKGALSDGVYAATKASSSASNFAAITVGNTSADGSAWTDETLTVYSTGVAGVATISYYLAANNVLLGTSTVTFVGTPASVSQLYSTDTILPRSAGSGILNAIVKDAGSTTMKSGKVYLYSSDTKVAGSTSASAAAQSCDIGATGVAACTFTVSDTGTATLTLRDSTTVALSTWVSAGWEVTVTGDVANTITAEFDKATYAPGERAILTLTVKDARGVGLATGTTFAFTAVNSLSTINYNTTAGERGTASSLSTPTVFTSYMDTGVETRVITMPTVSGKVEINHKYAKFGVAAGTPDSVALATATVSDPAQAATLAAAEAATDAAAEAIDAANAATDAANIAAEAADAATVAAEEARDAADAATAAVEELATQVATLMAALSAQVKTLANTVAKIAKKVKA